MTVTEDNPLYHFVGWYTHETDPDPVQLGYTYTLSLSSDTTVYAIFERNPQQRTVSVGVTPDGAGTATVQSRCGRTFEDGH